MRTILAHTLRATAVLALLAGGACDRSPTDADHADVAGVRLTIGAGAGTVVTVNAAGQQTPASLQLPQGTHPVVVTWLDASGNAIASLGSGKTLAVVEGAGAAGTGVSFTPNGLFAGTLQLTAAGSKSMVVRLMHGAHADFAQNVAFTVQ